MQANAPSTPSNQASGMRAAAARRGFAAVLCPRSVACTGKRCAAAVLSMDLNTRKRVVVHIAVPTTSNSPKTKSKDSSLNL